MTIREFRKDDITNGVLETLKENWYITEITNETLEEFEKNNNHMFVVEHDGLIIGCATLHIQKKLIRNGGVAGFIEDVIIRESYRGKNIGSELIQKLVQKAKNLGCYKVVLSCFPNRENFYIRNGFYNESINMRYKEN